MANLCFFHNAFFIFLLGCFFCFSTPSFFHFLFGCICMFCAGVFFLCFFMVHFFSIFARVYVSYVRYG